MFKRGIGLCVVLVLAGCQAAESEAPKPVSRYELPSPYKGLFGIDLGKPLNLPSCPKDYGLYGEVPKTCVRSSLVYLSADRQPAFLKYNNITVRLDDQGNVKKIHAEVGDHDWDINDTKVALTEKFGPIDDVSRPDFWAWQYKDYIVTFSFDYDFGVVEMQKVSDWAAEIDQRAAEDERERKKM